MKKSLCTCIVVEIVVICLGGQYILHQPIGHELIQDVWQASVIMACPVILACPMSHCRPWNLIILLLPGLSGCLGLRRFWSCLDWGLRGIVQDPLHRTAHPEHNHVEASAKQRNFHASSLACQLAEL